MPTKNWVHADMTDDSAVISRYQTFEEVKRLCAFFIPNTLVIGIIAFVISNVIAVMFDTYVMNWISSTCKVIGSGLVQVAFYNYILIRWLSKKQLQKD